LVAEGDGHWQEYVGGYSDWLAQRKRVELVTSSKPKAETKSEPKPPVAVKLSFKENRELESLPKEIEALEEEQQQITQRMSGADYHRQGADQIKTDRQRIEQIEAELLKKFERWEALEAKRGG
jgi:ATP-binding cassette subfamily F protein uup